MTAKSTTKAKLAAAKAEGKEFTISRVAATHAPMAATIVATNIMN
jgi:hypothetical protein